ncbi:uncharacterized protein LOC135476269 [Liolophura sinensis]|uniref:uncharacterized protein LOC135476269 n=1 Tax=Liolophura sinensis TaxID=3198878 RepID=UPI00315914C7
MGREVLLYVPNIIGYIRLALVLTSSFLTSQPLYFISVYSLAALLDGVDGLAARKLNQISVFGAWFDVVIDLISRGMVWSAVYNQWGYYVIAVEWMTFISTHSRGPNWKSSFDEAPWFARMVMAKGFKTPMGIVAIGSLHILPIWLYAYQCSFLTESLDMPLWGQLGVMAGLVMGRVLCLAVEIYCLTDYICFLLNQHSPNR